MPATTQPITALLEQLGDPTHWDRPELAQRVRLVDPGLGQHAAAVAGYVEAMTSELSNLSIRQRTVIIDAAWAHDVGKLTLSRESLLKPGPLSDVEWAEMREHPARGAWYLGRSKALGESATMVRQHHEWVDGRGYPDGLSGSAIELGARLIGVADAYDAMTSWRPYRAKMSEEDAISELQRSAGSQFDPELVSLFIRSTVWLRAQAVR